MSEKLLEMKVILKPAEMWDLFQNGLNKRLGQPFCLRSVQTNKFDNRCYIINQATNSKELKSWAEQGMVYVPASVRDLKEAQQPLEDLNWKLKTA